jgi:hypothetical protein
MDGRSSGYFAISTNDTERMRITSGGEVIVGGPTTNATLSISGDNSAGDTFLNFRADIGQTKAQIQGSKFAGTGGVLYFKTLQSSVLTTAMVINQVGNVGIGTTPINHKLQIAPLSTYGNAEDGNICIVSNPSGGTTTSPTTIGGIIFGDNTVTNSYMGRIAVIQDNPSGSTASHMRFYTNSGGGNVSTAERMRITSSGNVLIGTQTGVTGGGALQVNGNVNINGVFQINGVTIGGGGGSGITGSGTTNYIPKYSSSTSIGNSIIFDNGTNIGINTTTVPERVNINGNLQILPVSSSWAEGIYFSMPTTSQWGGIRWKRERGNNDGNWGIGFTALDATDDLVFVANNAGTQVNNIIRLIKTGNVLIGTATDTGYKFEVNGTGRFNNNLSVINADQGSCRVIIQNTGSGGQAVHLVAGNPNVDQTGFSIAYGNTNILRFSSIGLATFSGAYGTNNGVNINGTTYATLNSNRGTSVASAGVNYSSVNVQRWFTGIYENSDNFGFYNVGLAGFPLILNYSTGAATFSSSVTATSFFESSDKRLKKEISDKPIISGIEAVKPKLYIKDGKEELGYYAQDLQEILPSAVIESEDGFLSLSYAQVLVAKVASLEKRIMELEAKLN